ncbi:MAG: hypothetical protein F4Z44_05215, partial [Gemmatimonadetes bacterium]|nr:hypothetical protein [Gemmatimonadota bacterium]
MTRSRRARRGSCAGSGWRISWGWGREDEGGGLRCGGDGRQARRRDRGGAPAVKIAIYGAGATGGYLGVKLALAGV